MGPASWKLRWRIGFVALEILLMGAVLALPLRLLDGFLFGLTGEDVMPSLRSGWMVGVFGFAGAFTLVKEYWLLRGVDREWAWIEGPPRKEPEPVRPEGVWIKENAAREVS